MFETENKFYEENRETFRKNYLGKRVVIVNDKILGIYDTDSEAIAETSKTMELGTFCVKYVPVNPEEEYHRLLGFLYGKTLFSFVIPPFDDKISFSKKAASFEQGL